MTRFHASTLAQRTFDSLNHALACLAMLEPEEMRGIAEGLESLGVGPVLSEDQLLRDVAKAIREYMRQEAANG